MTLISLANEEQQRLNSALQTYGNFSAITDATVELFGGMVSSVTTQAPPFVAFYAQAKKHATLAFFSILRGHRTQYKLTLRYFLESLVQAAYSASHRDPREYWDLEAKAPTKQDTVVKRANQWLKETYPISSANIKEMKERINSQSSHANFVTSLTNFTLSENGNHDSPFFDYENDLIVKSDLLECTRAASIAIDLLLACSKDTGIMILWPDTQATWSQFSHLTDDLFEEVKNDPRWAKFKDEA